MNSLFSLIIKSFDFSGSLIAYIALSGVTGKYISPALGGVIFIYTFIAFYVSMGATSIGYKHQKDTKEKSSYPQQDSLKAEHPIKESRAARTNEIDKTITQDDNVQPEFDLNEAKINLNQNNRRDSFKRRYGEVWKNYTADWSRETLSPSGQIKQDIEHGHHILDACESEPEKIFLLAMITKYQLSANEPFLLTGGVTVELQRVIGRHRVDFLINNRFVVEIDGRK